MLDSHDADPHIGDEKKKRQFLGNGVTGSKYPA